MKLLAADAANLSSILTTCQIGGVESLIFDDGKIRGMNEERSFVIISDFNIPKLPCKMGVTRLSSLRQRLDMFTDKDPVIDVQESERGEVTSLNISAGKSKVQFRCTSTSLIKAPKSINDIVKSTVVINSEELKILLEAIKVMAGKTLRLTIRSSGEVSFGISDDTNDAFNIDLSMPAQDVEGDSVVHYYFADIFQKVMKINANEFDRLALKIGQQGTLRTRLHGHDVVLMPKINDGDDDE